MAMEEVVDKIVESGAVEKVLERIDTLALKLGTTAEHLWGILVKQAYVTFVGYSIRYVITIIFLCCMIKFIPYLYKKFTHEDFDSETTYGMFSIVAFVICILVTLVTSINIIGEITYFISLYFNPEYFAFQKIADFIH